MRRQEKEFPTHHLPCPAGLYKENEHTFWGVLVCY